MNFNISARTFILVLSINVFAGLTAFAQSSYELSCRNKAKEIAASTYKDCVTEQRQSQIEQIRKDYKEKMSELKNHYDNELKKMGSSGAATSSVSNKVAPQKTSQAKANSKTMRASGARSLPKKAVKTEVIDLTTGSTENAQAQEQATDESTSPSQNRLNTENERPQDVEIVELPTQE